MVTKAKFSQIRDVEAGKTCSSAPQLHFADVRVGFLPPGDKARYIYFPIGKPAAPPKRLGKIQKAILKLLEQKLYTVSGLNLAVGEGIGTSWNALLGLNRRGLLAHVFLTDVNLFGCPVDYHYYALAKDAGDGSLASRLELAIRCLEVAEGDRLAGQQRSLNTFIAHAEMANASRVHPQKAMALTSKAARLVMDFYREHPERLLSEATPTKTIPVEP
jgi:hypothetical protein